MLSKLAPYHSSICQPHHTSLSVCQSQSARIRVPLSLRSNPFYDMKNFKYFIHSQPHSITWRFHVNPTSTQSTISRDREAFFRSLPFEQSDFGIVCSYGIWRLMLGLFVELQLPMPSSIHNLFRLFGFGNAIHLLQSVSNPYGELQRLDLNQ